VPADALPSPGYLLLVEDNPGDARLTQALLADLSPSDLPPLRWVQRVGAALAMLRVDPHCQAVLLDLGLPDSQGLQTLQDVTRIDGKLPIIVLTGGESATMGMDAVAFGAQDFLVKGSFDAAMLQRSIAFAKHRKGREVELLERSLHDELTGLPRRTLLLDRLQAAMQHSTRTGSPGALLFVDLDRFKQVNDDHGHVAGDVVLQVVAQRLAAAVRRCDTVARLGGDEFVVLLSSATSGPDAIAVGDKLLQAILEPVAFEGNALQVSASIGVVCFAGESPGAERVMRQADAAMYAAKTSGKSQVAML
jgi:diguanylate cyclase (GGDEF)-like protein